MTPPETSDQGNMVSQRQVEWVLVPREPTEAMLKAANATSLSMDVLMDDTRFACEAAVYRAMLSAAPPPEPRADEGAVSQSQPVIGSVPLPTREAEEPGAVSPDPRRVNHCHADRDGDCQHADCPQLRDHEPDATGRHCPLDVGCSRCCLPDADCEC